MISRGWLILAVVVAVIAIPIVSLIVWSNVTGGEWRTERTIQEADISPGDELHLIVNTCEGEPSLKLFRETDEAVEVIVVSSSYPFARSGMDCLDYVEVRLARPLGDRVVIDKSVGRAVDVR